MASETTLIPKKGTWILIIKDIPVQLPIPPLTVWYAVPSGKIFYKNERNRYFEFLDTTEKINYYVDRHFGGDHDLFKNIVYKFKTTGKVPKVFEHKKGILEPTIHDLEENYGFELEQQLKIVTPWGECCIQPEEYNTTDINFHLNAAKTGDAEIKYLTKSKQLKGKVKEQVFYLRTRGIGFADAVQMCIANIHTQHLFYIEYHEEYMKMFFNTFNVEMRKHDYKVSQLEKDTKDFFYSDEKESETDTIDFL